jgi:glucosamine kinase
MSSACSPADLPGTGTGLGLDVGGTATRWALAGPDGRLLARGHTPGWTALQLARPEGRAEAARSLGEVAAALAAMAGIPPLQRVVAGVTGLDAAQQPALQALLGEHFGLAGAAVACCTDIELVCRSAFVPGQGMVVYAGTGSVAALVDARGLLQRAGGRGVLIDDAGGGHWIACRALRSVWRAEDEQPGAWQHSPLARALFARLGGADWAATRSGVYQASRGEVGQLALAVAEAADEDPVALAQLRAAGAELARLGRALQQRFGPLPVALAGRVWDLHPVVESAFRAAGAWDAPVMRLPDAPEEAAARWARAGTPVPDFGPT